MAQTKEVTISVGSKVYYNGKKHEVVGFPADGKARIRGLCCGGSFKTVDLSSLKV